MRGWVTNVPFTFGILKYNIISLSCHEQVCLSGLNVAHLNTLAHDMINLLYYDYWTDKQTYL